MSRVSSRLPLLAAALSLVLAACGDDGPGAAEPAPDSGPRTIEITMVDIAFEPTTVTVPAGEAFTFVFVNNGAIRHEAVFGNEAVQEDHEAEMAEMGGVDMDDSDMDDSVDGDGAHTEEDVPAISLEPGATGEIEATFNTGDEMIIGCHEPGHWAAGMRVDVNVEA
ncbi:MAG: cupredoxin domain-containing protein [Ilumatobacter sp.]